MPGKPRPEWVGITFLPELHSNRMLDTDTATAIGITSVVSDKGETTLNGDCPEIQGIALDCADTLMKSSTGATMPRIDEALPLLGRQRSIDLCDAGAGERGRHQKGPDDKPL